MNRALLVLFLTGLCVGCNEMPKSKRGLSYVPEKDCIYPCIPGVMIYKIKTNGFTYYAKDFQVEYQSIFMSGSAPIGINFTMLCSGKKVISVGGFIKESVKLPLDWIDFFENSESCKTYTTFGGVEKGLLE